ncbi:MAG: hypothetical protein EON98_11025 [Chitinophagaceae bacterium]|nr:MAG: hypothetical protein EON98_11025 [Chitinophagaceae bacterium]
MKGLLSIAIIFGCFVLFTRCGKGKCDCVPPPDSGQSRLSYGDSVFYLKNSDYTIKPLTKPNGIYTSFPKNLTIDKNTGVITVTQKGTDGESQTGMWYKVYYHSISGDESDSTMVLLSGITYIDKFYNLSQGDSIIYPIYNGDPSRPLPAGNYDLTSDNKFAINAVNGQINVKECMRRGFFNDNQLNTSWKVATIKYAINDKSSSVTNKIDIVIYYYHTMNDVPANVSALMQAHQQMTVGLRSLPQIPSTPGAIDNNLPSNLSLSKPRPPCVIIVGN